MEDLDNIEKVKKEKKTKEYVLRAKKKYENNK